MNKIDEFLHHAYDAQIDNTLFELDVNKIPKEFRTFIVDYVVNEEKTIGESLSEYLGVKA